jgi:hypothetical protein
MTQHNFDCKIVYNIDAKSINYDAKKFYINDNSSSCEKNLKTYLAKAAK